MKHWADIGAGTGPQLARSCHVAWHVRDGDAPSEEAGCPSATQDGIIVHHRFAQGCQGKDGSFWVVDVTFRLDISWTAS